MSLILSAFLSGYIVLLFLMFSTQFPIVYFISFYLFFVFSCSISFTPVTYHICQKSHELILKYIITSFNTMNNYLELLEHFFSYMSILFETSWKIIVNYTNFWISNEHFIWTSWTIISDHVSFCSHMKNLFNPATNYLKSRGLFFFSHEQLFRTAWIFSHMKILFKPREQLFRTTRFFFLLRAIIRVAWIFLPIWTFYLNPMNNYLELCEHFSHMNILFHPPEKYFELDFFLPHEHYFLI
jgi:hypothetical protein